MNILRKLGAVVCFSAFMPTARFREAGYKLTSDGVAMEHESLHNSTGAKYCSLLTQFLPLSLSTCA